MEQQPQQCRCRAPQQEQPEQSLEQQRFSGGLVGVCPRSSVPFLAQVESHRRGWPARHSSAGSKIASLAFTGWQVEVKEKNSAGHVWSARIRGGTGAPSASGA